MLQNLRRGFTLIEIMLVVIIIGILVAMIVPNIAGRSEQARKTAARTDIESNLSTALDLYRMDVGQYPTSQQGLMRFGDGTEHKPGTGAMERPLLKEKENPQRPLGPRVCLRFSWSA